MQKYYLTEITTKDNLILDGIYFEPQKKSDTALLYIHGLTSSYYSDHEIFDVLTRDGEKLGLGFASFNNRGAGMITGFSKVDKNNTFGKSHLTIGAGYEAFEECVYDIDAGISFLTKKGYKKVVLVGHSTGATKACFYAGSKQDKRLKGVVLAGVLSDKLSEHGAKPWYFLLGLNLLKKIGLGNKLFNNINFFPITPNRALSLIESGSAEDVFDYGERKPKLTLFSQIKIPLMVILSELDQYADRPVKNIMSVFDKYQKSDKYSSVIIKDANHGLDGKEKEFVGKIVDWIKNI
ncbi:alpha/beta hydrolase [Patescibacteria group bacterium]